MVFALADEASNPISDSNGRRDLQTEVASHMVNVLCHLISRGYDNSSCLCRCLNQKYRLSRLSPGDDFPNSFLVNFSFIARFFSFPANIKVRFQRWTLQSSCNRYSAFPHSQREHSRRHCPLYQFSRCTVQ